MSVLIKINEYSEFLNSLSRELECPLCKIDADRILRRINTYNDKFRIDLEENGIDYATAMLIRRMFVVNPNVVSDCRLLLVGNNKKLNFSKLRFLFYKAYPTVRGAIEIERVSLGLIHDPYVVLDIPTSDLPYIVEQYSLIVTNQNNYAGIEKFERELMKKYE
tara:strand:- start:1144 stop:1632 length:489 start_codon:yes stop_codon:yes gene_type:complete